jgi:hypothetical protein
MAAVFFVGTARGGIVWREKTLSAARKKRALILPAVRLSEITCS